MKKFLALSASLLITATSCQENRLDRIEREAQEYTIRNCPKPVDDITVLDSVVFHNDGSLNYTYYYTVTLDEEQREQFASVVSTVREGTVKGVRNSIELKAMKEAGLNFVYIYRSAENGKTLASFSVLKEDYSE
jgi:hypothetical protein